MLGAIVLAGGPSARFGRTKALVELEGKPLVRYVVDQCRLIAEEIVVAIGKDENPEPYLNALPSEIKTVKDSGTTKSPINGIATGIRQLDADYVLIVPCDTPFVRGEIMKLFSENVSEFDLAIPLWPNGYIEPLHAVYKIEAIRRVLPSILKNPSSRVVELTFAFNSVRYIGIEQLREFDPYLHSFFNINNPQDLRLAQDILRRATLSITI